MLIEWWPSFRLELECVMGLAPLLFVPLQVRHAPFLLCTDASSHGVGATIAQFDSPERPPPSFFLDESRWSVVLSARWRWKGDHINELECRGLLMALRWLRFSSGLPLPPGCNVRVFVDSLVVEGAVSKGRSSAFPLLKILRRITATLFTSDLRLELDWVSTHENPADKPSRLFSRAPPDAIRSHPANLGEIPGCNGWFQ